MPMVSGRVLAFMQVACARSGLDYRTLTAGLEELSGARLPSRLEWSTVVTILVRLEAGLGDPRALEELGRTVDDVPVMGPLRTVLGFFASPRLVYRAISTWFGPSLVPLIRATFEELPDGRLRIAMVIPDELPGSAPFFRYTLGAYRRVPTMVGQPEATVEAQISERKAEYLITPPPEMTLLARVGRRLRQALTPGQAIAELAAQQAELSRSYEELERYRADLESLLAVLPVGVVALRDGRVVYTNEPGALVLGVSGSNGVKGSDLLEFVATQEQTALGSWLAGTEVSERAEFTVAAAAPQGATLAFSRPRAFSFDGAPAILVTVRDVTSTCRLEEQLRQAQKMESVGRLAGGVAHDFNNLLSVIISRSSMGLEAVAEGTEMHEDLHEIRIAGERAAGLTRQLLAFSRKQLLAPQRVVVNDVISSMVRMLETLVGENIALARTLRRNLPEILVDPGQLAQVLMNLVLNARDAMPAGGRISIETDEATLDEAYARTRVGVKPGKHVMLIVSDSGQGMSEEVQARIFEPFFSTKELGKGTGLGLSTCHGIVRQSGGHIWVYSEPGRGTTFKVYFPVAPADAGYEVRHTPAPRRKAISEHRVVLLVEDDKHVRAVAQSILTKGGYEVLVCGSPLEAIAVTEKHAGPIHLVLSDVVMPGMNGRQLAERVRALRQEVQVLFMSGYTEDVIVHHGVVDADVNFLSKPLTPDALLDAVGALLSSSPPS